jgi:hypothetical protein
MFMTKTFFTSLTVIKVLADTAFVTDSFDWEYITAVALDTLVYDFSLLILVKLVIFIFKSTSKVLALQKLVEDFGGLLLEFAVNQVLKSFAWHSTLPFLFASVFLYSSLRGAFFFLFDFLRPGQFLFSLLKLRITESTCRVLEENFEFDALTLTWTFLGSLSHAQ